MKKLLLSVMSLVAVLMFASCDPKEVVSTIAGKATLTVSCSGVDNYYTDGQVLEFSSCVTDQVGNQEVANNVFIAARINLLEAQVVTAPYIGFVVNDTTAGSYAIDNVLTAETIATLSPANLLTSVGSNNVFVLVASDTAFYVAKSGTVAVSSYPASFGKLAEGSFSNLQCYYITDSRLSYLRHLISEANAGNLEAVAELASLNIDALFPSVTFNGTFNSRRMMVRALLDAMQRLTPDAK